MEQIAKVQEEVDGFFMNPQRKLISYMYMYLEIMCLNLIMSEVRLCPFMLQDRFIRMLVTLLLMELHVLVHIYVCIVLEKLYGFVSLLTLFIVPVT